MRGINALVLAVCAIAAVSAQEIPRFKSGVDVVHFTVTVLDKERRPISGLTAADFDVLVDGKPKPLAAFAAVTLPGESRSSNAATIPTAPGRYVAAIEVSDGRRTARREVPLTAR